jgi:hypothetical protein
MGFVHSVIEQQSPRKSKRLRAASLARSPAQSRLNRQASRRRLRLRIRDAKRALIDRTDIFGDFKTPQRIPADPSQDPWLMSPAQERRFLRAKAKDVLSPMQQEEAERSVAITRVWSELTKLSLDEKRAAARRDRTIRQLMKIKRTPKTDN